MKKETEIEEIRRVCDALEKENKKDRIEKKNIQGQKEKKKGKQRIEKEKKQERRSTLPMSKFD